MFGQKGGLLGQRTLLGPKSGGLGRGGVTDRHGHGRGCGCGGDGGDFGREMGGRFAFAVLLEIGVLELDLHLVLVGVGANLGETARGTR